MAVPTGLCGTWSETPNTGFLTKRLICFVVLSIWLKNVVFFLISFKTTKCGSKLYNEVKKDTIRFKIILCGSNLDNVVQNHTMWIKIIP